VHCNSEDQVSWLGVDMMQGALQLRASMLNMRIIVGYYGSRAQQQQQQLYNMQDGRC
jgi:hypothetical protein